MDVSITFRTRSGRHFIYLQRRFRNTGACWRAFLCSRFQVHNLTLASWILQ
jgi:hypothetical protein